MLNEISEISHFLINLNVSTFMLLLSSSSAQHNLSLHHQNFSAASFINVSVSLYYRKKRRLSYTRSVRAWDYSNQILIDEWILSSWELLANRANSIVILCRRASERVQFHSFSFRCQWLGGNGWNISTFDIDRVNTLRWNAMMIWENFQVKSSAHSDA